MGALPSLIYRSASPVPPVVLTLSVLRPAGTATEYNLLAPLANPRFDTGTPFVKGVALGGTTTLHGSVIGFALAALFNGLRPYMSSKVRNTL